jgi:hypothetical protein
MEIKVGDLVTAGDSCGRVKAIHRDKVEVELDDRPGLRFWFSVGDVSVGTPPPRPTMMAWRFAKKETTVEVRPVCKHINLADLCLDCARERGE